MSDLRSTTNSLESSAKAEKEPWGCIAITLDPDGKRYKTFLEKNNFIAVKTFLGVKGTDLSKEEMVSQGLATEDLAFSPLLKYGLVGNAASHKAIWAKIIKENKPYFILEDDCYAHPKVADFINENLAILTNVDICFFGINTDSILQSISPTGLASVSIFSPHHPSEEWIKNALSKTSVEDVALHRLEKAFGFCSYFISPSGAQKLSEKIFPLSLSTTKIPLISDNMPAISIDRAANSAYSQLQAFVCQPFLAYTPNTDSQTRD